MKTKTFDFGKIAFSGRQIRKGNEVIVKICFDEHAENPFSASGEIWNLTMKRKHCDGQCLDKIAKYVKSPIFDDIYYLWRKYCRHKDNLPTETAGEAECVESDGERDSSVITYSYVLSDSVLKRRQTIINNMILRQINKNTSPLLEEERLILSLPYRVEKFMIAPPEDLKYYVYEGQRETKCVISTEKAKINATKCVMTEHDREIAEALFA